MKYVAFITGILIGCGILLGVYMWFNGSANSSDGGTLSWTERIPFFGASRDGTSQTGDDATMVGGGASTHGDTNTPGFPTYTPIARNDGNGGTVVNTGQQPLGTGGATDQGGTAESGTGGGTVNGTGGTTTAAGAVSGGGDGGEDASTTTQATGTVSRVAPIPLTLAYMSFLANKSIDLHDDGIFLLKDTKQFTVYFIYHAFYFAVVLKSYPITAAHIAAEGYLKETMGLTSDQLCSLNIDVFMPPDVDPSQTQDLGFSKCPGPKEPTNGL